MKNIEIRIANDSDVEAITKLFYDTIQNVNCRDYPQEEIDDWSSWYADIDKWKERISQQYFIVALLNHLIVGFGSLATDGYLDLMFVHKDYQKIGIAKQLLRVIEEKAILQNNKQIYSDVSITARPFFESKGYIIEKKQLKKSREKKLVNYKMRKDLSNSVTN